MITAVCIYLAASGTACAAFLALGARRYRASVRADRAAEQLRRARWAAAIRADAERRHNHYPPAGD